MKKIISTIVLALLLPLTSHAGGQLEILMWKTHLGVHLTCDQCSDDLLPWESSPGLESGKFDIDPLLAEAGYLDNALFYIAKSLENNLEYLAKSVNSGEKAIGPDTRMLSIYALKPVHQISEGILNFRFFTSLFGDTSLGSEISQCDDPTIIKRISFDLTDEQARAVHDRIQEHYDEFEAGDLHYRFRSNNCIHFAKSLYDAAQLEADHGDFYDHVMSGEGPWSDNATIVDLLVAGSNDELSLEAAFYYLFLK